MRTASCLLIAGMFACTTASPSSDDPGPSHEGEAEAEGEGDGITGPTEADADLLAVHETDEPCTEASQCEDALGEDACRVYACSGAWFCTYRAPDRDEDGSVDEDCGGSDCNEFSSSTPGGEDCDGGDNDCDGQIDEGLQNIACPDEGGCGTVVVATHSCDPSTGDGWSECPPVMQPCDMSGEWNIDMMLRDTLFVIPLTVTALSACPPTTLTAAIDQLVMNCTGDMSSEMITPAVTDEPGRFINININCEGNGHIATFTSNMIECGETINGTYSGDFPFYAPGWPESVGNVSYVPFSARRME